MKNSANLNTIKKSLQLVYMNSKTLDKKKEMILREIRLEALKISEIEIQDGIKDKVNKEMNQLRIRISNEEVIKRVSFLLENEVEIMIEQCTKVMLRVVYRCFLSIQDIIEETENGNEKETIERSVTSVVREMKDGKWYSKVIEDNVELLS